MAHIRYAGPEAVLDDLVNRYPILTPQKEDIRALYELVRQSFASGGKLLVLGNGGSAADALHIVGELMKSFTLPRPIAGGERRAVHRPSKRCRRGDLLRPAGLRPGPPGGCASVHLNLRQCRKRRGGGHGRPRARHARGAALRRHGRKAAPPVRRERSGRRFGNLHGAGIAPARLPRPVPDAGICLFPTSAMTLHSPGGPAAGVFYIPIQTP